MIKWDKMLSGAALVLTLIVVSAVMLPVGGSDQQEVRGTAKAVTKDGYTITVSFKANVKFTKSGMTADEVERMKLPLAGAIQSVLSSRYSRMDYREVYEEIDKSCGFISCKTNLMMRENMAVLTAAMAPGGAEWDGVVDLRGPTATAP